MGPAGLRRTATDLLRRAAVDPVTAKAIIGHTTDRMREHYSTVGTDEARRIGARLVSLVPAVSGLATEVVDQLLPATPSGENSAAQLIETT